ncbi:protein of unknown function DUF1156 [Ferroglobus placidus DSM 10642]|uniref:DUF1156 domain-containing protein n=1 Tax=Ferroglobus placidus (strain DSM 10642 / AEDII12DO) TaxID=589924 RepID=D3RZ85_FERPA|nr:RsmD family RNA methyltransferase [Ferroglobus placidus]ADC65798.1 protein of unknown function DUF1156 [Ferroglobus placidus DSM 10642]
MSERLIKYYFPTFETSEESIRERAVISPPMFYLHLWWARRPLIGSRVTIAASTVKVEKEPDKKFLQEFKQAVSLLYRNKRPDRPAYNYSPNLDWVFEHADVKSARLLDVFAGGGSIPFEALRLGFKEVVAVEYNPIAYILLKATLEYPLKYREKLVKDVEKWGRWLLERVREELAEYYPRHPEGEPANYIWIRVYRCRCGKLVPAISHPILSKENKYALKLDYDGERPVVRVVKGEGDKVGTGVKSLNCPDGHTLTSKEMSAQYRMEMDRWEKEEMYGHHPAILAAVKLSDGRFVEPTDEMVEATKRAGEVLRERWQEFVEKDLIPTEEIPEGDKTREVLLRSINKFYKLFNARQLLTHATIVKLIREAYEKILNEGEDEEYAKAVVTYLALAHGKLLDYNSVLTSWDSYNKGSIRDTFNRHAYRMGQDFAEGDLLSKNCLLEWALLSNVGVVSALKKIVNLLKDAKGDVKVVLGNAKDPSLYLELGEFDYVVTDPPYYANVQYSELADFFYVWHKRSIGHLYPEAFSTELTPKEDEIVVNKTRKRDEKWFESSLKEVLELVKASLKPDGIAVFMYAHRSLKGLKVMLNAALDAGFIPFAVWGFASEQPRSIHIVGKAAVKTMLVLGLKPKEKETEGIWDANLRAEVRKAIEKEVERTINYNLSYSDAILMGMGAAFEVVGKHWPLYTYDGRKVDLEEILQFASSEVSKLVLEKLVSAPLDQATAMYLMARVVYGEPEYDSLRYLAYGLNYDHEEFIEKYTSASKKKDGTKAYKIKPLTEIKGEGKWLVDAIASSLKAYLSNGPHEAIKVLEDHGYKLDEVTTKFLELILAEGEPEDEEKMAIQGLLMLSIRPNGIRIKKDRIKTLDEFINE